ncbi:uncharacterized protein B0H18DRAFT_983630 [Fomitopsis serialis]|uniref:uncharacterized protein n=1 Tax=Fomitopsis serialis TaxID=139415 RepID=UPI002007E50C|nr:uncharacterized protein B0H18DRAFT_983630 [Neoantrodia serialis]KAH9933425.1 hypothetical protein B0H18DRAFT_983630 [Neoantrodia serialis]
MPVMPFSFSFTLAVPGLTNPFSNPPEPEPLPPQPRLASLDAGSNKQGYRDITPVNRRAPSPSLQPPLSRKRGWVPSAPEYSSPIASPTSTSGYLDTPAKYREMASAYSEDGVEEMVADLPPPKRRRTLAGSIVSTALSAALIGTAVGLTVYRLWRDRGKAPESLLPPPYEQGEWLPPKPNQFHASPVPVTQVTPPTPRSSRKSRHVAGRRTHRHRKVGPRAGPSSISSHTSTAARAPIPPEFNFGAPAPVEPEEGEADDQMSWMGGRLAALIAEGQRALGKEVVVMSEAQEDEEDDGGDGWIEEDDGHSVASSTRTSRRRWNASPPPYSTSRRGSPFPSASPRRTTFDLAPSYNGSSSMSIQSSPRRHGRDVSAEPDAFASRSFIEDESQWQTPELREAMERARQLRRQDYP